MASNTVGRPGKNTERSQYHHFIPRFILRNFADPNQFPTGPAKGRRKSKSKRRDALINSIDLHSVNVEQRWLSSEFGIVNMYREEDMGDGYDLEKRLSVLESDAARTIHKAKEALASGDRTLSIPRGERDCLRKFFFLMKYRNSHFYQRYNHESLKTYNSMDKRALSAFMKDRNLKRPKDVWFLNIRTFLSLEMDAKKQWMDKVQTLAYRDDALMFILHAQGSFMSFCTPESEEQEFVLTDNAYGIFEGPVSPFINAGLGTIHDGLCIEYHNFAPISPKLLIVFRSFVLPTPEDDGDTELRTVMLDAIRQLHIKPDATDSILKDLPVTKCQNSYSKIMDGKVVALPSFQEHRSDDLFFFTCFRLNPDHVDLINEIFLEQAWATSSIAFRSKNAMQRALRIYLRDKREGFKVVTDQPDDPRLKYLKTLETIVSRLGGSAMKALYQEVELPKPEVHMSHWVAHVVAGKLYKSRKDLYEVYKTLTADTSPEAYLHDVDQAGRMMFMRIKVDSVIHKHGINPIDRTTVKLNLQELFCSLPAQRLWFYLKIERNMSKFDLKDFKIQKEELSLDGLEDMVAKSSHGKVTRETSYAMFYTVLQANKVRRYAVATKKPSNDQ